VGGRLWAHSGGHDDDHDDHDDSHDGKGNEKELPVGRGLPRRLVLVDPIQKPVAGPTAPTATPLTQRELLTAATRKEERINKGRKEEKKKRRKEEKKRRKKRNLNGIF